MSVLMGDGSRDPPRLIRGPGSNSPSQPPRKRPRRLWSDALGLDPKAQWDPLRKEEGDMIELAPPGASAGRHSVAGGRSSSEGAGSTEWRKEFVNTMGSTSLSTVAEASDAREERSPSSEVASAKQKSPAGRRWKLVVDTRLSSHFPLSSPSPSPTEALLSSCSSSPSPPAHGLPSPLSSSSASSSPSRSSAPPSPSPGCSPLFSPLASNETSDVMRQLVLSQLLSSPATCPTALHLTPCQPIDIASSRAKLSPSQLMALVRMRVGQPGAALLACGSNQEAMPPAPSWPVFPEPVRLRKESKPGVPVGDQDIVNAQSYGGAMMEVARGSHDMAGLASHHSAVPLSAVAASARRLSYPQQHTVNMQEEQEEHMPQRHATKSLASCPSRPGVESMVMALRSEDPRLPSARISLLQATFRACWDLRMPMLKALALALHERLVYLGQVLHEVVGLEQDPGTALSKDQGMGLVELLSSMASTIREEMGMPSPVSDDESSSLGDEIEEEEDDEEDLLMDVLEEHEGNGSAEKMMDADGPQLGAAATGAAGGAAVTGAAAKLSRRTAAPMFDEDPASLPTSLAMEGVSPHVEAMSWITGMEGLRVSDGEAAMCLRQQEARQHGTMAVAYEEQIPMTVEAKDGEGWEDGEESKLTPEKLRALDAVAMESLVLLINELVHCLELCLKYHARKISCSILDKAEFEHMRDACMEVAAAHPPAALQILSALLRTWPKGNSNREVSFLSLASQVLGSVGNAAPSEAAAKTCLKVYRRVAQSARSAHLMVADEAVSICGSRRLCPVFLEKGAPRWSPWIERAVLEALQANVEGHWHAEVRRLSKKALVSIRGGGEGAQEVMCE